MRTIAIKKNCVYNQVNIRFSGYVGGVLPNPIEKFLPGLFGGRPCGIVSNCPAPVLPGRDIAPAGGSIELVAILYPVLRKNLSLGARHL